MNGYQSDSFNVAEVRGQAVRSLIGFGAEGRPEKLLLEIGTRARFELYLDAGLAFWHELDEEGHRGVLDDYSGQARVDYAAQYSLRDAQVLEVSCTRSAKAGTCVEIRFASGSLRFRQADPTNLDSESLLEFASSPDGK